MDADLSDEQLMLHYAAGDTHAFDVLYARHRAPLFRFLLRGLSQRAQAEECFQEVWSRVIAARQRYRPEAAFTTWLYQIAHRLLIDQYRRHAPETADPTDDEGILARLTDEADGPEQSLSDFEQRRRLQQALESLPDEQRIAVQLRLEQELSLEAIGEVTGVGRETVKSRLRYALDRLRARLTS